MLSDLFGVFCDEANVKILTFVGKFQCPCIKETPIDQMLHHAVSTEAYISCVIMSVYKIHVLDINCHLKLKMYINWKKTETAQR